MNLIHIESGGKSARVGLTALREARPRPAIVQQTSAGPVVRVRVFNGASGVDPSKLTAADVIDRDPEIDLATAGRRADVELTAAYFDPQAADLKPIGDFKETDILFTPDGTEKERRPHLIRTPNLDTAHPIKLLKRFPIKEALTSFVFRGCFQLVHEDGLAHEFLHQIAADLQARQEMALLGAGPKGNLPLVTRIGGSPYRAFLHGEVNGEDYKLVVMLSDQELKKPAAPAASA